MNDHIIKVAKAAGGTTYTNRHHDGTAFVGINAGFIGPAEFQHLGSGFFIAEGGDWWPAPPPLVFKLKGEKP